MEQDLTIESDIDRNTKGAILILLVGCSLLVFVVGGYNNFWSTDMRLLGRIGSVLILFVSTFILYKTEGKWHRHWKLSSSFLIVSIGFLLTWFFGNWHLLIPGLSVSTVEGVAIAKVAEVVPLIMSMMVGIWLIEKDFTSIYLRGGNLKKSFKLGILVSPAALLVVIPLGILNVTTSLGVILSWMPWLCLFSISNAFYEELMIRGLFLRKFSSLFGKNGSLILTSLLFGMIHIAIIGLSDVVTFSLYFSLSFLLGLLWGYVIQKSDSIWGAVLAHTIADILLVIATFGV
ncbi:MAG: CPBP family intramembrane glutamic endopeptidase [Candidatus Thorarchaeota archaeon]|jgi:membrane protease YdiL (CAAX protease family)